MYHLQSTLFCTNLLVITTHFYTEYQEEEDANKVEGRRRKSHRRKFDWGPIARGLAIGMHAIP